MLSAGPEVSGQFLGLLHWFTARKRDAIKRVLMVTVHQFSENRLNCEVGPMKSVTRIFQHPGQSKLQPWTKTTHRKPGPLTRLAGMIA